MLIPYDQILYMRRKYTLLNFPPPSPLSLYVLDLTEVTSGKWIKKKPMRSSM